MLCNAFKMPVSAGVVGLLIRLQCPRTFCSIICNGPEGAKPVAVQGIECLLTRLWMMVEDAYGDIGDDVKDGTGDSTGLMLDTTTVRDDVANTTQPNCNDTSNVISSAPESVAFHRKVFSLIYERDGPSRLSWRGPPKAALSSRHCAKVVVWQSLKISASWIVQSTALKLRNVSCVRGRYRQP